MVNVTDLDVPSVAAKVALVAIEKPPAAKSPPLKTPEITVTAVALVPELCVVEADIPLTPEYWAMLTEYFAETPMRIVTAETLFVRCEWKM